MKITSLFLSPFQVVRRVVLIITVELLKIVRPLYLDIVEKRAITQLAFGVLKHDPDIQHRDYIYIGFFFLDPMIIILEIMNGYHEIYISISTGIILKKYMIMKSFSKLEENKNAENNWKPAHRALFFIG